MRTTIAALLALIASIVLIGQPLMAAEAADGPKVKFEDAFIDNLVGDWDLTRSVRGQTVKNRVRAEWVLHHQFLKLHMTDVATPPEYEALLLIGYSHADQEYVIHWCDVWGGKYSSLGRGKRDGDKIEFVFKDPDGSFFNTFSWNAADHTWTFRMEGADSTGARTPFATDVLHRPNHR
jgi:hypothetical protein